MYRRGAFLLGVGVLCVACASSQVARPTDATETPDPRESSNAPHHSERWQELRARIARLQPPPIADDWTPLAGTGAGELLLREKRDSCRSPLESPTQVELEGAWETVADILDDTSVPLSPWEFGRGALRDDPFARERDERLAQIQAASNLPPGWIGNLRASFLQFSPEEVACAAEFLRGPARAEMEGRAWAAHLDQKKFEQPSAPESADMEVLLRHLHGPVRDQMVEWRRQLASMRETLSHHPEGPGRLVAGKALLHAWLRLPRARLPRSLDKSLQARTAFYSVSRDIEQEVWSEARFRAISDVLRLASRMGLSVPLASGLARFTAPTDRLLRPAEASLPSLPPMESHREHPDRGWEEQRLIALRVLPEPHFAGVFEPRTLQDARALSRVGLSPAVQTALIDALRESGAAASKNEARNGRALALLLAQHHLRLALYHRQKGSAELARGFLELVGDEDNFDAQLIRLLLALPSEEGTWVSAQMRSEQRPPGFLSPPEAGRMRINAQTLGEGVAPHFDTSMLRPEELPCFKDTADFVKDAPPCEEFTWSPFAREAYETHGLTHPLRVAPQGLLSVPTEEPRWEYLEKPRARHAKICTAMACPAGAFVGVVGTFAEGFPYVVELRGSGGSTRCTLRQRRGRVLHECEGPLSRGFSGSGFRLFDRTPSVRFTVSARGQVLLDRTVSFTWGYVEPNGRHCGSCLSGYVSEVR